MSQKKAQVTLPQSPSQYQDLMQCWSSLPEHEKLLQWAAQVKCDLYFLVRYFLNRPALEHPWLFERCRRVHAEPNGHLDR